MKYLPIYLILLLTVSCQQSRKAESGSHDNSNLALDSLVYEQLLAKFELDDLYEKMELEMVEAQKEFIKANPKSQLNKY